VEVNIPQWYICNDVTPACRSIGAGRQDIDNGAFPYECHRSLLIQIKEKTEILSRTMKCSIAFQSSIMVLLHQFVTEI
jgi:hypothetical protein